LHYKQIVEEILAFAGQGTGGQAETLVKRMVNTVYFRVLEEVDTSYEDRVFTASSISDQPTLGMPLSVRKILNIEDPTTPRMLSETSARSFDRREAGSTDTGTPYEFFVAETRGTQKYPSTNGTITVNSSSTEDSGSNFKIRVEGFNNNGDLVTELITMNGTSLVASTNSYSAALGVERVVKATFSDQTFTGDVTVKDNAGNQIAHIPVMYTSPNYITVELNPIPGSVITYNIRAEMRVPPLINDYDWPKFDEQFHDILIFGVTQDLLAAWGKSDTAGAHRVTFGERMEEFTGSASYAPAAIHVFSNVQNAAGYRSRPGRPLVKGVDFGLAS
jgi:hypothetical protein